MKNVTKLLLMAAITFVSGVALAQTPTQTPAAGAAAAAAPAAGRGGAPRAEWPPGYLEPGLPQPPYMPANTPLGTGPYKAIMATEPGAEEFVAYYPDNMAALGKKKLPVVMWVNGSCTYRGNKFRHFLTDIASYGYFAMAGGPMGAPDDGRSETIGIGSNNPLRDPLAPRTPPAATPPDPNNKTVTVALISQGIDWVIAENKKPGSKWFNKLDTKNIAVMGQSCGGQIASNFGSDPRVKTVGLWSGATGGVPVAELKNRFKANHPVLIITGDARYDICYYDGLFALEALKTTRTPVFYAFRVNMTHLGTYRQTDGGELSPIARAWLDLQLKGDKSAGKMFKGVNNDLSKKVGWHTQSSNFN